MNFIHMADLHIGAKNKLLPSDKQELLKSERLQALSDLFLQAKNCENEFMVICGDLFHSKTPQPKLVKQFFELVKNFSLPVIYVKGNHDEKWQGEYPDNFIILNQDRPCVSVGEVDVWSAIDSRIIKENFDKKRKNILLLHGNIENPSDNDYVDIKGYLDIPFDYVAMGHIHTFKAFSFYGKNFVYSGSLFSNGFDECDEKGYVQVSMESKSQFKFIPLAGRYFRVCQVDKTGLKTTSEIVESINEQFATKKIKPADLVRVELIGYFEEDEDLNLTMIKNAFLQQFYFEIIDKTRLKIDLEKLKNESLSFKAEFIKLVEESDLSPEDKTSVCLVGIEALKGEDLSL